MIIKSNKSTKYGIYIGANEPNIASRLDDENLLEIHPLVRVRRWQQLENFKNENDLVECSVCNLKNGQVDLRAIPKCQLAIFDVDFENDLSSLCLSVFEEYDKYLFHHQDKINIKPLPGIQEIGILYKKYRQGNETSHSIIYKAIKDQLQMLESYLGMKSSDESSQIGLLSLYNAFEIASAEQISSHSSRATESLTGLKFKLERVNGTNQFKFEDQLRLVFYLYNHHTDEFISEPHTIGLEIQKGTNQ